MYSYVYDPGVDQRGAGQVCLLLVLHLYYTVKDVQLCLPFQGLCLPFQGLCLPFEGPFLPFQGLCMHFPWELHPLMIPLPAAAAAHLGAHLQVRQAVTLPLSYTLSSAQ